MNINKLLFSFLLLICITSLNAQKYANYQFVVFSYSVDIDERVQQELRTVEGSINYNPSGKQSKVDALLIHSIYNMVTKTFADSLKVFFLPANFFGDKVKLNEYGYPDIVIQKAIRLADMKYYIKIDASVSNSKYDEKGKKNTDNSFMPVVNISIDIYNKFGFNPIQSSEGQAMVSKPVIINPGFIAGLNFVSPDLKADNGVETMERLITKAMYESLYGIMYKKQK
jgi:hypothetical protein